SVGAAAAGAAATADVTPTVEAYTGAGATLRAGQDVTVTALSAADAEASTYGIAAGFLAIGTSQADATAGGSVKAHLDGPVADSDNVTVSAAAPHTAHASAFALAGGV